MTIINNSNDLISYLLTKAEGGNKNWFGFTEQKIAGADTAYKMAIQHGDKMTPDEIVNYVALLNMAIYKKLIRGENT